MTKEDLKKDHYYIVRYTSDYIIKYSGNELCHDVDTNQPSYNNRGSFRFGTIANHSTCIPIREANQLEINWLDACIKANKFIPLSEIKQSIITEIY